MIRMCEDLDRINLVDSQLSDRFHSCERWHKLIRLIIGILKTKCKLFTVKFSNTGNFK